MPSRLDELVAALSQADCLPFLFVGSGVSRRYLGHEDWRGLLTRAASLTDRPYQYYASRAQGDPPQTATNIAEAFHEAWWQEITYRRSRRAWGDVATGMSDPLKIEVAARLQRSVGVEDPDLLDELRVLSGCQVDGVITTNYDRRHRCAPRGRTRHRIRRTRG